MKDNAYADDAHGPSFHGKNAMAVGTKEDLKAIGGAPTLTNEEKGVTVAKDSDGAAHHPKPSMQPHQFPKVAAPGAHGFGHSAAQRAGHLRNSGSSNAHRIGKKR